MWTGSWNQVCTYETGVFERVELSFHTVNDPCSIGSLGKDGATDIVSNIKVNNATITGTENGARIKSWQVI